MAFLLLPKVHSGLPSATFFFLLALPGLTLQLLESPVFHLDPPLLYGLSM
ncbi:hypothetical protein AB0A81_20990 [Streptomyces flaveolus]|uniref:Uncharacterized protein n=1 Tax=Streptomyces flaveolus TaxID=67297 RepID=A0ABV1VG39_9ACTN